MIGSENMGSIYKRCPFKKGYCNNECGLYDKNSLDGCTFLQIEKSLEYIGEGISTILRAQEHLISVIEKGNAAQTDNEE